MTHPLVYQPKDTVEDVLSRAPLPHTLYDRVVELEDTKIPGHSPILRNNFSKDKLYSVLHPDITTTHDIFTYSFEKYADQPWIAYPENGDYGTITFREGKTICDALGSGLRFLWESYVPKGAPEIVSVYLANVFQYLLVELACSSQSYVTAGLYDLLGLSLTGYILELTELPIVFVHKSRLERVLQFALESEASKVSVVITIEDLSLADDSQFFKLALKTKITLLDFRSVVDLGKKHPYAYRPPKPEDVYLLCFTSGTTGTPKGVLLTHRQVCSLSTLVAMILGVPFSSRSYEMVPLAHCYQRGLIFLAVLMGHCSYFPSLPRDPTTYFDDIKRVKPAYVCVVPRILNRLESTFRQKFGLGYLLKVIDWKVQQLSQNKQDNHFIFDRFVRPKIKEVIGFERLAFLMVAAAPISRVSMLYLQAVLGVYIHQGYGSTETFCSGALCVGRDVSALGTLGGLGSNIEARLSDVPDLGYTWEGNHSGELTLRGPGICKGYFKKEELWKECLDEEGFYHTGDVAMIDENGRMSVIDRVKNMFKLSQGKYIASEKVQNAYQDRSPLVEQAFVEGDSLKSYLVGILGISIEESSKHLEHLGVKCQGEQEILDVLNSKQWKPKILQQINDQVYTPDLMSYEMLKNVVFMVNPFTVDNSLLTPTLKIKRAAVRKQFKSVFEKLYEEGEVTRSAKL